jgi:hypothetical protein
VVAAATVAWVAASVFLTVWWLQPGHVRGDVGGVVNTALLAFDLVALPAWFLFFAARGLCAPAPPAAVPSLRVAMVVTKAPSEPFGVVRRTLRAMLAQDHDEPYAVWLADEDPDARTARWCRTHGVGVTTRRGIDEYHRATWPRRTRCKEGNLAWFYDTVGYEFYDVVLQLDADHVPDRGYLRRMLAPFADPAVGYVAAPSICDANAAESWSARGRLHFEAMLHGVVQAGADGGYAPCCIGSHYAVRTSALREIGGLGPELAEDFSTTVLLNAAGWEGAFARDAIAHGDGPACFADCVTQEFQWARSMMTLGLTLVPEVLGRLALRARLKIAFCVLWYPLFSLWMLVAALLPGWALLSGRPPATVPLGAFWLHTVPSMVVLVAVGWYVRRRGLARPVDAPLLSWEALLFQLARWPWALLGCAHAVAGRITGETFQFKVTPKGDAASARPLPLVLLVPYLLLIAVSVLPVLLVADPGAARGYVFWSHVNGIAYLAVTIAIVVLHVRESPRAVRRVALRLEWRKLAGVTAAAGMLAASVASAGGEAVAAIWQGAPTAGTLAVAAPVTAIAALPFDEALVPATAGHVALGAVTASLAASETRPWDPAALDEVNGFEHVVRRRAGIVMWFSDWTQEIDPAQLQAVAARGSVPEITWAPWQRGRVFTAQRRFSLARIAGGAHDAYVRRTARRLRDFGRPVLLRFAHEMNGPHYPWAAHRYGNHTADFIAAWRHVHDLFAREGATNVSWVWAPMAPHVDPRLYPGDDVVDVVGLSGFNGGTELAWNGWRSFSTIYGPALATVARIAPSKPVQVSEVSSTESGGSKARFIREMFAEVARRPQITSLVWFDVDKEADWRVGSSPAAERAFRTAVAAPYFGGRPWLPARTTTQAAADALAPVWRGAPLQATAPPVSP